MGAQTQNIDAERYRTLSLYRATNQVRLEQERIANTRYLQFYPDDGPLRRELYPKHLEFFRAGSEYRERLLLAANRIGKSEGVGGYELTLHLTGLYPDWWEGKRFNKPVRTWAAGDTGKTTRDIIQLKMLGPYPAFGTGLIPKDCIIGKPMSKAGVPEAIEIVRVKHHTNGKEDGVSVLIFKSYDQRREAFQGTEQDVIWLDEEPPLGIYTECLLRTMTTGGPILCTFTPLLGLSEVVLSFLPGGQFQEIDPALKQPKYVVMATWDDAPHLSQEQKESLWTSIPPHQRDARTKGIPQLGSGAIYPLSEDAITCEPFNIPEYWPKVYALDVGWNWTASLWGAIDRESDIVYLYSEYKAGQAEPPIHAAAVNARGNLPGVIDPASRGRSQIDGQKLLELYQALGLNLTLAENAREAGIYEVWQRLSTGRLKVFKTLTSWLSEYRIYRRDENGKIVKENDHLMDDTRYLMMSGLRVAGAWIYDDEEDDYHPRKYQGRSSVTGY